MYMVMTQYVLNSEADLADVYDHDTVCFEFRS